MADEVRMFTLEARPQAPTPAMLTFRRNSDAFPEVVMSEEKAFESHSPEGALRTVPRNRRMNELQATAVRRRPDPRVQ